MCCGTRGTLSVAERGERGGSESRLFGLLGETFIIADSPRLHLHLCAEGAVSKGRKEPGINASIAFLNNLIINNQYGEQ